ncbi:MAG: glycosyltransferase [Lachnospiraceae bacterium]|nr:glycosyltransferase [Lachnospiraceae bacterium]
MKVVFSVIVPVYNVEAFLPRCLDSILKQGCKKYELIMVDDGSTDSSGRICDEYAERFPQCRVVHKANGGLASARNAGIKVAQGKYIVFVDSDDYIEKELLTKAYYCMEEQGYEACSFAARRVTEAGVALYDMRFFEAVGAHILTEQNRKDFLWNTFLRYSLGWEAWIYVYRKDILDQFELSFDEQVRYAEDLPFTYEYMRHVNSIMKLPDILYNYTMREASITQTTSAKKLVQGIFEGVFRSILSRLTMEDGYLCYAAMLRYFIPTALAEMDMAELRAYMYSFESLSMQKEQWQEIIWNKEVIESTFGHDAERIYETAMYFDKGEN